MSPLVFKYIIKRAFDLSDRNLYEVKINGGMAQEPLNGIYISAVGQQVGGKAVSQAMDTPASCNAGFFFAL